jgi:hypothetical protein
VYGAVGSRPRSTPSRLLFPVNEAGLPAVAFPVGPTHDGLPLGPLLARAELQLDHLAAAATWAARGEAVSNGMPPLSAGAERALAAVMVASGDAERAADVALGAAAAEDELGARIAASR